MVRSVKPEVRWGIRVAKVCLPIFVCWAVYVIVMYPSPLAVVGLVTVPIYAAAMGLLLFSVGWAAGVLRARLRAPTRPPAWQRLLGEDHLPVDVRKRLACDPEPMVRAATGWACETVGGGGAPQ